jgi:hypothetical protein
VIVLAPLIATLVCLGLVACGLFAVYGGWQTYQAGTPRVLFRPICLLAILVGIAIAGLAAFEAFRTAVFTAQFFGWLR